MKKITKARTSIVLDHPFFASILLRLRIEEKPVEWFHQRGLPSATAGTDGKKIFFNPEWVEELSEAELTGVMVHEVMHIIMLHHVRMENRNPRRWNAAGDYAINLLLKHWGFSLPGQPLLDDYFQDMSTEKIYELLGKEIPSGKENSMGEVLQPSSPEDENKPASEEEIRQIEQETKVIVRQAITTGKSAGKFPEELSRLIEEIHEVRVPWREVLSRFLSQITKNDYSWAYPNRRFLPRFYLPSLESPSIGKMALFMDTSGSVSEQELISMVSETLGILDLFNPGAELLTLYIDAKVAGHQYLTSDDIPHNVRPVGGGGTDFRPGFEWLKKKGEDDCVGLIYMTDGYCKSWPDEPDFPVLWVLTEENSLFNPPFGEVILMRE